MSSAGQTYFKDFRSVTLQKEGGRHDWPLRAEYSGRVSIRISANNAIKVSIMGPHAESADVRGDREFGFMAEPGTEFRVMAVNEQRGILGKAADVMIEVEMRGPPKAIEIMTKLKNYNQMLSENPDFYPVIKDSVQQVITQLAETGVWGNLGADHRDTVKELTLLLKKLHEEYTS